MKKSERELQNIILQAKERINKNPVSSFTFPCGCKILGAAPTVDKIILCDAHKSIADQMNIYAPDSAKKLLLWWE